jgi:hypothetical protein
MATGAENWMRFSTKGAVPGLGGDLLGLQALPVPCKAALRQQNLWPL